VEASQDAIIKITKMVDDMAESVKWGGQVAVTQMMNKYVKAQKGRELFASGKEIGGMDGGRIIVSMRVCVGRHGSGA
jgi:hypothetical protein